MKSEIIYEDESLWVIYKPAGLATQSARISQPDVVSELTARSKDRYVGLVHRLDQPVEGLLVVGKEKETSATLSRQLLQHQLGKDYYAVVYVEKPDLWKEQDELCDWLRKDSVKKVADIVTDRYLLTSAKKPPKDVQRAKLCYHMAEHIERPERLALADISIETGRFHQIRAQMAHAKLPLMGDYKYAAQHVQDVSRRLQVKNVALCAYRLMFYHPKTGKEMTFEIKPQGAIFGLFQVLNQ